MHLGGEVASSSLPEKNPRRRSEAEMGPPKVESAGPREARQNRTEYLTCSTIELPPRDVGEDRTRTDNHARLKRSNPDFTTWRFGARRRSRTGLVRLTRSARRSLRLTGIWSPRRVTLPGLGAHLARFRLYGGRFTLNYTAKVVASTGLAPVLPV